MVSINLGGIVTNGGKTRIFGVSSGLDSEALINAAVEAKMLPVNKLKDQITLDNEKISALQDLKTLFTDLYTSTNTLRSVPGYSEAQKSNILSSKKVELSSSLLSQPNSYIEINASSQVSPQSFDITVDAIAKAKIQKTTTFADLTSSVTDISGVHNNGMFTEGTFQINSTDITLVAGDNIADIVEKINNVKSETDVSATIIQPTVGQYAIQLESLTEGISNAYTITDNDNVLNDVLSQLDTDVQDAADSQFTINGNIIVTRPTNSITDYIDGINFNLINTSASTINAEIVYDKDKAIDALNNFAERYNAIINFINEQQAKDEDGEYLDSAKIRRNDFASNAKQAIALLAGESVSNNDEYTTLGAIGLSFPSSSFSIQDPSLINNLYIDQDKLADTAYNHFENLKKLLEFQYTTTSKNFIVTKRSNNIGDNLDFSINVDITRAEADRAQITYGVTTINATFVPNDAGDLTKGGFIIGPSNTPFSGFEFQYTGTGANETTNISASQGVMDKLYNQVNYYLSNNYSNKDGIANSNDAFDFEISFINEQQTIKDKQIEISTARIEILREALILRFSAVEAVISKANSILTMLDIQQQSMKK